jgi:hypothetical protein
MSDEHLEDQGQPLEPLKDYSAEIKPRLGANKPDTDQLVEEWFDSHIRGSIVGQSTQIWNHIMVAKERLKEKLRGAL